MAWITELPWRTLRRAGYVFRRIVGTREKPNREFLLVEAPIEVVRDQLRMEHFREGWMLSYHHKGEDANLSRAEYKSGVINDIQLHIRLFDRDDDRTEVHSHVEIDPTSHPRKHLNGEMHSTSKGTDMAEKILNKAGLVYDRVGPNRGE